MSGRFPKCPGCKNRHSRNKKCPQSVSDHTRSRIAKFMDGKKHRRS